METGDDALLKWLKKPASVEAITNTVRLLKQTDITVGVIVLLGAGGREFAAAHVQESVRLLNELLLGRTDYIYFSLLISIFKTGLCADTISAPRLHPPPPSPLNHPISPNKNCK